jgi:ankyrin repeat protein
VQIEDVDGIHPLDPSKREELVELLLKKGADPNIVAANGVTALDVAQAGRARSIAALLERRGGRRAVDL